MQKNKQFSFKDTKNIKIKNLVTDKAYDITRLTFLIKHPNAVLITQKTLDEFLCGTLNDRYKKMDSNCTVYFSMEDGGIETANDLKNLINEFESYVGCGEPEITINQLDTSDDNSRYNCGVFTYAPNNFLLRLTESFTPNTPRTSVFWQLNKKRVTDEELKKNYAGKMSSRTDSATVEKTGILLAGLQVEMRSKNRTPARFKPTIYVLPDSPKTATITFTKTMNNLTTTDSDFFND